MSKETATTLVNQFVLNPVMVSKWPQIQRLDLGSGLLARIENPNLINQSGTPLCGPATLVRSLAQINPDGYAQAAIDIYTKAQAKINNLTVTPGAELLRSAVPANTDPADWLMLCSVRDSSNWFLSPGGWFGNNLAGITVPATIEKWFKDAGYTKVINDTSLTGGDIPSVKSMCVQRASQRWADGYNVAMLVDSDVLKASNQDDILSLYPDHWIVLASTIDKAGTMNYSDLCSFKAYTWGTLRQVPETPPGNPLTYEKFLNKFYGFVAAKL
ncbi:MAG: hypothetical protein ABI999_06105 [Acidobacteriota bacterium]